MDKVTVKLTRDQISHISFALGITMGWMGRLDLPENKDAPELSQKRNRAYADICQIFEDVVAGEGGK